MQLLVNAADVYLLSKNTIRRNTEALLDTCMEGGSEVNTEKTKSLTRMQDNIRIANKSLKNVAMFKYLGMTTTNRISFMNKLRAD
jgi:hypothetical protein